MITSEEAVELRKEAKKNFYSLYLLTFFCFMLNSCDLDEINKKTDNINKHLIATAKESPRNGR